MWLACWFQSWKQGRISCLFKSSFDNKQPSTSLMIRRVMNFWNSNRVAAFVAQSRLRLTASVSLNSSAIRRYHVFSVHFQKAATNKVSFWRDMHRPYLLSLIWGIKALLRRCFRDLRFPCKIVEAPSSFLSNAGCQTWIQNFRWVCLLIIQSDTSLSYNAGIDDRRHGWRPTPLWCLSLLLSMLS